MGESELGRILVAMSGGVDSSVAAALLREAGHELIGVTFHLWDAQGTKKVGRCCAPEDRDDARRTCEHLGIPHYVIDERDAFRSQVVEPFMDEYLAGRTPSPCVHCNRGVKLAQLASLADRFGATHVATGHYARVAHAAPGRIQLLRGHDVSKDQSYFLFGVSQRILRRMIFPLGSMRKEEARAHGRRLGVPNADKPDSQELCFVPDGNVGQFIADQGRPLTPGRVVGEDGVQVGVHEGIAHYTVGQRRGIGGGSAARRYVLRIAPDTGDVVVGSAGRLMSRTLRASDARWVAEVPTGGFFAQVRIRYRHEPAPGWVTPDGAEGFQVQFDEPQRAVTPGQAAVVYKQDEVVGGGFIA